ncbi:RNA recognition motif domain-containing protein [Glaciecola siphonariae]|uniref:RNA recognition motif domain-containing protein n=1 Tax=Glaciecola siphonariae TaxID=521012 RepID=A0ABV9LTP5_9ALTE
MKILVRNLARTTGEAALEAAFAEFGSVQACNLVMDTDTGTSKGFGFVDMPKASEAKAAIQALNYKKIDGNKIRVKKVEPKSNNTAIPSDDDN